jgi:hypothetical protein
MVNDLKNLDREGLKPEQCKVIQDELSELVGELNGLSQSSLLTKFVNNYEEFRQTYIEWNGRDDDRSDDAVLWRRVKIGELLDTHRKLIRNRSYKKRLAKREATSEDAAIVRAAYSRLRRIVSINPILFPGLASSVGDVERQTRPPA